MNKRYITPLLTGTLASMALFTAACSEKESTDKQDSAEKQDKQHSHTHKHGDGHDHDHHHNHDFGDGHDHHTPHHGIVAAFKAGDAQAGFAELKLHDDKGDLELWLTKDKEGKQPFDLPLDAVITVAFPKLDKTVELRVRNTDKNEDEDGQGNIRNSATNYFIFPGDSGADASWLVGKEFASQVTISFSSGDSKHATETFELRPHTH